MSHFTVLVIGENPEEQLAPFQENNMGDCPVEYLKFNDTEDENLKNYQEQSTNKVVMPDGRLLSTWDDEFRVSGTIGVGGNSHKVPDDLEIKEVKFTELFQTFEEYMTEWCGSKRDEKANRYGYWENPNAKWDWYQLGGRWTGFFKFKQAELAANGSRSFMGRPADAGWCDQTTKDNIDFEFMRNEAGEKAGKTYDIAMSVIGHLYPNTKWEDIDKTNIEQAREIYWNQPRCKAWNENKNKHDDFGFHASPDDFLVIRAEYIQSARESAICTHAVIKDGKWYERGEMGWWAIVTNEKEKGKWESEYSKLLDSVSGNTLLSVFDCHI